MAALCSVLIPSRARPDRLLRTIRSVWSLRSTTRPPNWPNDDWPNRGDEVEVLVRLDADDATASTPDPTTGRTLIETLERAGVRVLIGERREGYNSLASFYAELSAIATAPWIWIMNDDAYVARALDVTPPAHPIFLQRRTRWDTAWKIGKTWIEQLRGKSAAGNTIVHPELYKLGQSCYFDCKDGAFPIVPRDVWKRAGYDQPHNGIDTFLDRVLRHELGWSTRFLVGTAVVHERDTDAELAAHRQM